MLHLLSSFTKYQSCHQVPRHTPHNTTSHYPHYFLLGQEPLMTPLVAKKWPCRGCLHKTRITWCVTDTDIDKQLCQKNLLPWIGLFLAWNSIILATCAPFFCSRPVEPKRPLATFGTHHVNVLESSWNRSRWQVCLKKLIGGFKTQMEDTHHITIWEFCHKYYGSMEKKSTYYHRITAIYYTMLVSSK